LASSPALKLKVTYFSEIPVDFEPTTWIYIPEGRTLRRQLRKIDKSYKALDLARKFIVFRWFVRDENFISESRGRIHVEDV
jgi:hypothetical protein